MPASQFNPAYLSDPSLYGDQQAIEQRQQLATLLMQNGLTPSGNTEVIGGVAIKRSPLEGAAKMAQLLSGQSMQRDTNLASQDLMQRQAQAMMGMFGSPQQGQAAPPTGGAQQPMSQGGQQQGPQQTPQGGTLSIPGLSPGQNFLSYSTDPGKHLEAIRAQVAPTDLSRQLAAQGIFPGDPRYAQANADAQFKGSYVAPVASRPGTIDRDPRTMQPRAFNPQIPEGSSPVFDASGNVVGVRSIDGVIKQVSALAQAKEMGSAEAQPTVAYGLDGTPVFSTKATDVRRGGGAGYPMSSDQMARDVEGLKIVQREFDRETDPGAKAALGRELAQRQARMQGSTPEPSAGSITPTQRPGTVKGAEDAQGMLTKRFEDLQAKASEAQTTTSYLQSIKALSGKAATGAFTDKLQLVNSLIQTLPGTHENATDATTANNLLDKYSNQIVARLGQGGLGTDSARAILQSAYPNAKMTKEAINEAADNLIGANAMVQAKARVLSPHGNSRDPVGYQQKEQLFDQAADPRVWQFQTLVKNDPKAAAAFAAKVKAEDPQFSSRIRTLQQIGAL